MGLTIDPVLMVSVLFAYLLSLLIHQALNIIIIPRFTSRAIKKKLESGEWSETAAALVSQAIEDEGTQRNIAELGKAFTLALMQDNEFSEKANQKLRAVIGHITGAFGADARQLKKAKEALKEGLEQGALSQIVGSPQIAGMLKGFSEDQGVDLLSLLQVAHQMGIIRPGMLGGMGGPPQAGGHAYPPAQQAWGQAPPQSPSNGGGW